MSYKDIYGWFDFEDYYANIARVCPDNGILVEVGVWMGKSIVYLGEEIKRTGKNVTIFAVDTWRGSPELEAELSDKHHGYVWHEFIKNIKSNGMGNIIVPMCLPSVEAARYFVDESVFMVFIDAAHEYDSVKSDLDAWMPKVKPGGILSGHDALAPGVSQALNEKVGVYSVSNNTWWTQRGT